MTINPLRLLIIPAITTVFYLIASYITINIVFYVYGLGSFDELIGYISSSTLAPIVIFESLPLFLISLLFTMQYSMTSTSLKSIGYAFTIAIVMAIVKLVLIILFFNIVQIFNENRDLIVFGTYPIYFLFVALLFMVIGLVSHYYFVWIKQEVNPVDLDCTSLIASISYLLLFLFPPVVTGIFFAVSFNPDDVYSYIVYDQFGGKISTVTYAYIVSFIYFFVLVLFWTHDIIKTRFAFNTYATSTIKAYVFTLFGFAILYIILMCVGFLIVTSVNPWRIARSIPHAALLVILIIITLALLFLLARIVKSLAYKIYHVVTCVVFIGVWYIVLLNTYIDLREATIIITTMVFSISLVLCLFALCIRSSLKIAFK